MNINYFKKVNRWDILEIKVNGPSDGNPFVDQWIFGEFFAKNEIKTVDGFYNGDGEYIVRFMPSFEGSYNFNIKVSFSDDIMKGNFLVLPEKQSNHGPVRVSNKYHFAFEDGEKYYPLGTTCYVWHLQSNELQKKTLETLSKGYFNKIRFCIFPKHYLFNLTDPIMFPYEGIPCDCKQINKDNFNVFNSDFSEHGNKWNFSCFNTKYFEHIENCIKVLGDMGIEADLIIMHPYDRWGFSSMSKEEDDLYLKYLIARLSSFHNVWWSLANEYELVRGKTIEDWERFAKIICEKDSYNHLRSIHNWKSHYDFRRPWVTHCSIQRVNPYMTVEETDKYRIQYEKPIVLDEIVYEGNIKKSWGNISGKEMTRRFWEGIIRGGYPGHGETYENKKGILWWSHGGILHGDSPERIKFLSQILHEAPGNGLVFYPIQNIVEVCAVPDLPESKKNCDQSYYLIYFGFNMPSSVDFDFDDSSIYSAEVIDTWDMTINKIGEFNGKFSLSLPKKEYIAIRLIKK